MSAQLKRIDKAMTQLVLDQPFFAVLAMRLQQVETSEIPTFATDGKRLLVNPEFCAKLADKEIITILAHEVLHCALGHIWRIPTGADCEVWNQAVDNETNWELERANVEAQSKSETKPFVFPASCPPLKEDRFRDWAAEKIYKVLAEEKAQQEEQEGNQNQKGQSGKGQSKGPGKGQNKPGMGDIIPAPKDDEGQLKQEWEKALVQAEKMGRERGHIPGAVKELIQEITNAKMDWRALLRNFVSTTAKEDWSFSRPNTRFECTGFLMPSLYNEKPGHLVFAVDTSGSIDLDLLAEFIAEAQQALDNLQPEKLILIQCDAQIQKVDEYQPGDKIKCEGLGRGGTDFKPVFDYFKDAENIPKALVYLTDLYGDFPVETPEYPVLWVTKTSNVKTPFGDVIEV